MNNHVIFNDEVGIHPGYVVKQYLSESNLSQQEFAYRLGTTSKNLSLLIRGKQAMSIEMASKLSKLLQTSVDFWMNYQLSYDKIQLKIKEEKEYKEEIEIYNSLDINYFIKYYYFTEGNDIDINIKYLKELLYISSLKVLTAKDFFTSYKRNMENESKGNILSNNIMISIGMKLSLSNIDMPSYNPNKVDKVVNEILKINDVTNNINAIKEALYKIGIDLVVIPNLNGSTILGASKKISNHRMILINDKYLNDDMFLDILLHEIYHIKNKTFGINTNKKELEEKADIYAKSLLKK